MPKIHTHYDNLKVARNAPPEVIRAAYKTLSQRFHPDLNPNNSSATQIFQLINTAYEVLSDPVKRRQHDEWIAAAEEKEAQSSAPAPEKKISEEIQQPGKSSPHIKQQRFKAGRTVAAALKNLTNEQRTFTYLFCSLVATLIFFIFFLA